MIKKPLTQISVVFDPYFALLEVDKHDYILSISKGVQELVSAVKGVPTRKKCEESLIYMILRARTV